MQIIKRIKYKECRFEFDIPFDELIMGGVIILISSCFLFSGHCPRNAAQCAEIYFEIFLSGRGE